MIKPLTEAEGSRVIVTWVQSSPVDLHDWGIDENQAAGLRRGLAAFTED